MADMGTYEATLDTIRDWGLDLYDVTVDHKRSIVVKSDATMIYSATITMKDDEYKFWLQDEDFGRIPDLLKTYGLCQGMDRDEAVNLAVKRAVEAAKVFFDNEADFADGTE